MLRVSRAHGETWETAKVTTEPRTCPDCGKALSATPQNFEPGYGKGAKYLSRRCRPCESKRQWRDPEWFWCRQRERDRRSPEEDRDAWGGHEARRGDIIDDWPEYGDPDDIAVASEIAPDDADCVEDDYSEDSLP